MAQLAKGLIVDKKFQISNFIESDSWGDRYQAVHVTSNRLATIHLLNRASGAGSVIGVLDVSRTLEGLVHRHILESFGGGYIDPEKKLPYVAYSFIEGDSLASLISKKYPLGTPPPIVLRSSPRLQKLLMTSMPTSITGFLTPETFMFRPSDALKLLNSAICRQLKVH
jgi:hypothetical protein